MDNAANAYISMLEMTRMTQDEINPSNVYNDFVSKIEANKKHRIKLTDSQYALKFPTSMLIYHHSKEHSYHSISLFHHHPTLKNIFVHVLTSKGSYPDASRIYQNIQTVVDNNKTVMSDDSQTKGGRNLWRNIHNHVKFKTASLHNEDGTHVKDVENFSDLSKDESDPYLYAIRN